MKRYFRGWPNLSLCERGVLSLLGLVVGLALLAGVPAAVRAEQPAPALSLKNGQISQEDAQKFQGGVICYDSRAAFYLPLPTGWTNSHASAERFNVCGMYYPQGHNFYSAPAVMYPVVYDAPPGASLEERAQKRAQMVLHQLKAMPGSEKLTLRTGKPYTTANGQTFAVRFFDNGPPPNTAEATAVIVHNGSIFEVVLSALSKEQLEANLDALYAALEGVAVMDCVVEK